MQAYHRKWLICLLLICSDVQCCDETECNYGMATGMGVTGVIAAIGGVLTCPVTFGIGCAVATGIAGSSTAALLSAKSFCNLCAEEEPIPHEKFKTLQVRPVRQNNFEACDAVINSMILAVTNCAKEH